MSKIAQVFKEEVVRLARKEAKAAVTPIRKPAVVTKKALADLKRRVALLEKTIRSLSTLVSKIPHPKPAPVEGQKARITGKGMRSLRRKLRLTQEEFGKLVGVSDQAIYLWERRNGPIRVRDTTKASILAARGLGAREAKERLTGLEKGKKGKAKKAGRKSKK